MADFHTDRFKVNMGLCPRQGPFRMQQNLSDRRQVGSPGVGFVHQRSRDPHHRLCVPRLLDGLQRLHRHRHDPATHHLRVSRCSAPGEEKVGSLSAGNAQV
jgi:hypothetical protein